MKTKFHSSRLIYRATRGNVYDPDRPRFNCYLPAESGSYSIFDAWPCDKDGNIHPGYCSPVPVPDSYLGAVVGEVA